ncbi:MAG: hypothetical protein CMF25_03460 [Kangiellaceae bacterium]|nr:hypothetical protein [Kangiellaceae bacterium]
MESDAELVESPIDDDAVAGYAVHGALHFAPFHLNAEYLKSDEISDLGDAEIEATQLEASFDLGNWTLATAYQTTDDAEGFLPETRISLGASTELMENVGLGIEIWRDEDYDDSEADNLVLQIAASF